MWIHIKHEYYLYFSDEETKTQSIQVIELRHSKPSVNADFYSYTICKLWNQDTNSSLAECKTHTFSPIITFP